MNVSLEQNGPAPPDALSYQTIRFDRQHAFRLNQQPYEFHRFSTVATDEQGPEWAKQRPFVGLAYQEGPWTVALEYARKGRPSMIDRGFFNREKLFAGVQYQPNNTVSLYAGISRNISAGVRFQLGDEGKDEIAFTFFSRSPNREVRNLLGVPKDTRGLFALTYRRTFW